MRFGERLGILGCLSLVLPSCSRHESPGATAHAAERKAVSNGAARTTVSAARAGSAEPVGPAELLPAEERTWTFESTPIGRMRVVVLLPERHAKERFPVLVAMHGRGEALKGPDRGARGWVDDYAIGRVIRRLKQPPLNADDFKSFVSEKRLATLNRALREKPYRGVVLVCPYTPDMLGGEAPFSKAPPLARFIVDELLPRVYRETPADGTAARTGIDGVSLGGRAALTVGLLRPEAFGVVAGLQAAFDVDDADEVTERARRATEKNAALRFRLLTSAEDYFLPANTGIARAMQRAGVPVQLDVVEGPHDYEFNRGPGAIEMLVFHDRALRGERTP